MLLKIYPNISDIVNGRLFICASKIILESNKGQQIICSLYNSDQIIKTLLKSDIVGWTRNLIKHFQVVNKHRNATKLKQETVDISHIDK